LSISQFEKMPVNTLVSEFDLQTFEDQAPKQACLFNF